MSSMPSHVRAKAGPRQDLPPLASTLLPFIIFATAMFVVYQVNRHEQLHDLIEEHNEGEQFVTGGRKDLESGKARHQIATDTVPSSKAIEAGTSPAASSVGTDTGTPAAITEGSNPAHGDTCHAEEHAEYHGGVVQWGEGNLKATAGECCAACQAKAAEGCNVWVWCGNEAGCGNVGAKRPYKECWLKKGEIDQLLEYSVGKGQPGVAWTSGVLYSEAQEAAYKERARAKVAAEAERIAALRAREDLPLVYLDVSLKGKPLGRMEFVLFTDTSPLAAENMRRMCTGEVSSRHTLKGANFYRIIDQFIDQTGVEVGAALGGTFKDDPEGLKLKHDRKGLLSVANGGPNTNTGHFSILMGPAPHLNTHYVIFGEMVSGWEVAVAINKLSQGQKNNEMIGSRDAIITDVGQLRRGTPVPDEVIKAGLVHPNL